MSSIGIHSHYNQYLSCINRRPRGKTARVAREEVGTRLGVVAQMLRPKRVLVIFYLKAKDTEGFDSTVGQNPLSISRAFKFSFLFERGART